MNEDKFVNKGLEGMEIVLPSGDKITEETTDEELKKISTKQRIKKVLNDGFIFGD